MFDLWIKPSSSSVISPFYIILLSGAWLLVRIIIICTSPIKEKQSTSSGGKMGSLSMVLLLIQSIIPPSKRKLALLTAESHILSALLQWLHLGWEKLKHNFQLGSSSKYVFFIICELWYVECRSDITLVVICICRLYRSCISLSDHEKIHMGTYHILCFMLMFFHLPSTKQLLSIIYPYPI